MPGDRPLKARPRDQERLDHLVGLAANQHPHPVTGGLPVVSGEKCLDPVFTGQLAPAVFGDAFGGGIEKTQALVRVDADNHHRGRFDERRRKFHRLIRRAPCGFRRQARFLRVALDCFRAVACVFGFGHGVARGSFELCSRFLGF